MEALGSNDDFILPSDVDTTLKCIDLNDLKDSKFGLPFAASISLICYFYLFWMYFIINSPVFKRHPTTLAIYKCLLEALFVQQYLWIPFMPTSSFYSDNINIEPYYCKSSSLAGWLAFITQFALLGSELCFLIISMDLRMAYTNPFSSYKQNRIYFALFVILASLSTSIILMLFGDQVYGLSDIAVVWIQSRRKRLSPNYPKFLLYYLPSILIFIYCIWANFQFYKGHEKGFTRTISNRLSIMERSKRYTAAYVFYGCIVFLVEFISFVAASNPDNIGPVPAYFNALRGIWGLLTIIYSNYSELSLSDLNPFLFETSKNLVANVAQERLLLQPHLNTSLRAEILYFTTQGIIHASRELDHHLNHQNSHKPSNQNASSPNPNESNDPDEIRMYSFDENPSIGIRPSFQSESGGPTKSLFHRLSIRNPNLTSRTITEQITKSGEDIRNTFSEIEKLEKKQDAMISKDVEAALIEEAENLGLKPNEISTNIQNSDQLSSSYSTKISNNPLHKHSNPNGQIELHDRNSQLSQKSIDEEKNSFSSVSTVKWRDTMDVEFGIRYSQGPVKGIEENSEFPSWKRIDSVNMQARNVSSDSQSSNNSSIKKVIQTAMSNARNVFSPAFREFRFKDFCPKLFAKVREMHNISATEYSNSFETTCRERFSEGRSGAFMFYSSDQRCIVKTTKKEESQTLHRIMSKYVSHLESNPNSLIVRFLGSHCITMYGVEIYFVVMLNVFPIASLSERYDLKGSWVNRYGFKANRLNKRHRFQRDESESSPLYQDNDLQHSIKLEPDTANSLAGQIRRDILFLQSMGFMDYSLLVGVKRERFRVLPTQQFSSLSQPEFNLSDLQGIDLISQKANSIDQNTKENFIMSETNLSDINIQPKISSVSTSNNANEDDIDKNNKTVNHGLWRLQSKMINEQDMFKRELDGAIKAQVVEGPGSYYIGIIDILQEWNWSKFIERWTKIVLKCNDSDGLSAIPPEDYSERFWKRCVIDVFEGIDIYNDELLSDDPSRLN